MISIQPSWIERFLAKNQLYSNEIILHYTAILEYFNIKE